MKKTIYKSIEEVFKKLVPSYGHRFKEFDVNHRLEDPTNKGALGQIVEEGILGYPINSNPEADLKELGIEVKTTGVIENKNGSLKAKERLAIDSLNYEKIVNFEFEDSPMWTKADDMLFVFYGYIKGLDYGDMRILKAAMNRFDKEDIKIIKDDYYAILSKIKAGKAEEISEGDTMYLGACTAGTGALQNQPFSKTKAKQRKFCLKQSFFSQLIQKYVSPKDYEHSLSLDEIKNLTFEMALRSKLNPFFGKSEDEIRSKLSITSDIKAKNRYERYIAGILGVKGDVNETEEFLKSDTELKTIRVKPDGSIKESMSFPYFEFTDIVKQNWESSEIRDMFASKRYLFAIFQEKDGKIFFDRILFWNMSESDLDSVVKPVFDNLKEVLLSGNIVSRISRDYNGKPIRHNNFPGMADNQMVHVRPHGRNAADVCLLPVPDNLTGLKAYTKQCFWLNSSYIAKVISGKTNKDV